MPNSVLTLGHKGTRKGKNMSQLINKMNKIKLALVANKFLPADSLNKLTDEQVAILEHELMILNARAYRLNITQ